MACLPPASLPSQPLPVEEMGAGQLGGGTGPTKQGEALLVPLLGLGRVTSSASDLASRPSARGVPVAVARSPMRRSARSAPAMKPRSAHFREACYSQGDGQDQHPVPIGANVRPLRVQSPCRSCIGRADPDAESRPTKATARARDGALGMVDCRATGPADARPLGRQDAVALGEPAGRHARCFADSGNLRWKPGRPNGSDAAEAATGGTGARAPGPPLAVRCCRHRAVAVVGSGGGPACWWASLGWCWGVGGAFLAAVAVHAGNPGRGVGHLPWPERDLRRLRGTPGPQGRAAAGQLSRR